MSVTLVLAAIVASVAALALTAWSMAVSANVVRRRLQAVDLYYASARAIQAGDAQRGTLLSHEARELSDAADMWWARLAPWTWGRR